MKIYILIFIFLVSCVDKRVGFYKNIRAEHPVFYQLLIDRFYDGDRTNNYLTAKANPYGYHGGDLKGVLEKIDYLKELGINALLISPVLDNIPYYVDFQGYRHYGYHGYWPDYFDKIEENFGDFRLLKKVASELHKNGIAYIQDIVLNHVGYKSHWVENPLWVRSPKYGGCIDNNDLKMCLFGLPDFKTEREDVRRFLINSYKNLFYQSGFDGVRIDAMKHIDKTIIHELREELRENNQDIVFIGEYWGSSADEKGLSLLKEYNVDFLFDFEFRDYLSSYLRGVMRGEAFVAYLNKRYEIAEKGFIVFLNSHDLDGLITHFDGIEGENKVRLYKTMAMMQFISGGVPLIYYGEENGIDVGKGIENRRDMSFNERYKGIRSFYKELIALKKSGILNGKFLAEFDNGILVLRLMNFNQQVICFINRAEGEKEFHFENNLIKLKPYDFLLLKKSSGGLEDIIPH
ncbi:MAG: alpha-amylase family glycosyl hydrolase [Myxococcota bacterium]